MDIACAPSTETFKSRLIEAIRTELLSSHRREPSPPSMQAWVQEDNPCRHSETGDLGKGLKKTVNKIVHRLFFSCCYYITQFYILHLFYFILYIFLYFTMH